jgi:hypothetical protein
MKTRGACCLSGVGVGGRGGRIAGTSRPSLVMIPKIPTMVLYSRRGCHLCEHAADVVAALVPAAEIRDVDADAATQTRYGDRVPVLEVDGAVVMEGRFDERGLAAWLAARATDRR